MVRLLMDFLSSERLAWLVYSAAVIAALAVAWMRRHAIQFQTMRLWYGLPLIGRVARMAKDLNRNAPSTGWYNSEWELCNAFYPHFPPYISGDTYKQATDYLQKAQQIDRRETPWFFWIIVFGLLVAEAGSFGLLVTVFVAPTAVTQDQYLYGWIAAIVFAVVMLVITHRAGHETFVNLLRSRVRDMRRVWFDANSEAPADDPKLLALDTTSDDDRKPAWLQLANRVDGGMSQRFQPSYIFTTAAIVFALFFAITTFFLRDELFQQLVTKANFLTDWGTRGPLLAFGILSAIFVALQVVSGWLGYHYGFAGLVARQAAHLRGMHPSVVDFERAQHLGRAYVERIAQNLLTRLQNAMISQDPMVARSKPHERTFQYFCVLKGDGEALKQLHVSSEQSHEAVSLTEDPIRSEAKKSNGHYAGAVGDGQAGSPLAD